MCPGLCAWQPTGGSRRCSVLQHQARCWVGRQRAWTLESCAQLRFDYHGRWQSAGLRVVAVYSRIPCSVCSEMQHLKGTGFVTDEATTVHWIYATYGAHEQGSTSVTAISSTGMLWFLEVTGTKCNDKAIQSSSRADNLCSTTGATDASPSSSRIIMCINWSTELLLLPAMQLYCSLGEPHSPASLGRGVAAEIVVDWDLSDVWLHRLRRKHKFDPWTHRCYRALSPPQAYCSWQAEDASPPPPPPPPGNSHG